MRGRRRIVSSGLVVVALVLAGLTVVVPMNLPDEALAIEPVFDPNVRVDDSPGMIFNPKITVDSGGVIHVVWENRTSGTPVIDYSQSVDNGLTWSASVTVNATLVVSNQLNPAMAVNGSGPQIYVAWGDDRDGDNDIWISVSPDGGASWDPAVRVDDAGTAATTSPAVAVDDAGKVHVAWEDQRIMAFFPKVFYANSTDDGATWSGAVRVDIGADSDAAQPLTITASGDGNVTIGWRRTDANGDLFAIEASSSMDGGSTWTMSLIDVAVGGNRVDYPDITSRPGGVVYATWTFNDFSAGGNREVRFSMSDDFGLTWTTPTRVDDALQPPTALAERPTISIAGGDPYVVWMDRRNDFVSGRDIFASGSDDGGVTWGDGIMDNNGDSRVDDTGATMFSQQMSDSAASPIGIFVVWADTRNGLFDVYFARMIISRVELTEIQDSPDTFQRVEITNFGGRDIDFTGYSLVVDGTSYDISAFGVVPAGEYRTVGDDNTDLNISGFALNDEGGTVEVWSLTTGLWDIFSYGQMGPVPDPISGESTARYYDGLGYTNGWARDVTPTFGAQNDGPGVWGSPTLILNEVLYDVVTLNPSDRFIELYYIGTTSLNTTGYTLVSDSNYTIVTGGLVNTDDPYFVVYFADNNSLFNWLDAAGDNVYLYDDNGWLLDMVGWTTTHTADLSVCRSPVGAGTYRGFDDASSLAAAWRYDCPPTLPLVSIAPAQIKYANLGDSVRFDLTVRNKQSVVDTIDLASVNGPSGWTVEIWDSPPSFQIASTGPLGANQTFNISILVVMPTTTQLSSVEFINVTARSSTILLASETVPLQLRIYPYLAIDRTLVPSTVDLAGSGGQEVATVTLNATGLGFVFPRPIPQDVVMMIDSSGSMAWNDPSNLRLSGAKDYIGFLSNPDRVAVLDFDSVCFWTRANIGGPEHHLDSPGHDGIPDYSDPIDDVDTIDGSGGTNLLCPILDATTELSTRGIANHTWVAIMLTDGQDTNGNSFGQIRDAAIAANAAGVTIFTICLGLGCDIPTMTVIADETGGKFFFVPDPKELWKIYKEIHDALSNRTASDPFPGFSEPMFREVLPPYISVVPGSFYLPPWSNETDPNPDTWVGNVMEWNVTSIDLNDTWIISYDVTCNLAGTNPVAIYPDARVTYLNWNASLVVTPFPERLITCIPGVTPPVNVTSWWDPAAGNIGVRWDEPLGATPDHYFIYKIASDPRGFADLSPLSAYANVSAPAITWTDAAGISGPGEFYYVMRSANGNNTDISSTSNTAGIFAGALNVGLTAISNPLDPFPWVDYSGAERNTVDEYRGAFSAQTIEYMDASGRWQLVPGTGNANTPLDVGRGYLVGSASGGLFVFTGLPGAHILYDEYGFAGFSLPGDALSLDASVTGNDVTLTFAQPAGMGAADYYEVYYATSRAGFFDGTAQFLTNVLFPQTSVGHTGALTISNELYYIVVPISGGQRGASTYSIGVWTRTFQGHETFGLPLHTSATVSLDWYCNAIQNTLGMDFYAGTYWVGHFAQMPAGVYDTDVVLGAGYQITVSPTAGTYTFVGW